MKDLRKNRFNTIQVVGLLTVAFLGVVTVGYAIQFPHDFRTKTGQVISANEVMENFEGLNAAVESNVASIGSNGSDIDANTVAIASVHSTLPRMAASIDGDGKDQNCDVTQPCGMVLTNTVDMTGLADGYLIISGSCYVDHNGPLPAIYKLVPMLDGNAVVQPSAAAFHAAGNDVGPAERFTLSYTVSVQVAAGDHLISQEVGPAGAEQNFDFNQNNLTVLHVPLSQGAIEILP